MNTALVKGLRLGSLTNPTVVALSEFKGRRLLDIRKFFFEETASTLKPTKKGISLNAALVREIRELLNTNWDAIEEWLTSGDETACESVERAMAQRSCALESESTKARPHKVKKSSTKGAEFFSVESVGGIDELTLNEKHPFFNLPNGSTTNAADSAQPLNLLLISYYRAKLRFNGQIETEAEQFFELFEHEWGLLLKNYCENSPLPKDV